MPSLSVIPAQGSECQARYISRDSFAEAELIVLYNILYWVAHESGTKSQIVDLYSEGEEIQSQVKMVECSFPSPRKHNWQFGLWG